MPLLLNLGRRRLNASLFMVALTLATCAAFSGLGAWQWQRGDARTAARAQFAAGASGAPLALGSQGSRELPRYAHVELAGSFDGDRQVLLDNMSHDGKPGYEVLTPLRLADGRLLLVNRGWVPFTGYRERLPDVSLPGADAVRISGRLDELPTAGLASGRAAPATSGSWPRLATFPSAAELQSVLGGRVEPRVLLLDRGAANGYVREWAAPGMEPARHYAYAVQWWAMALAVAVIFVVVNLEKPA